ncbi:cupin domain-containing protein [Marinobacterium mangrovicola]|uniref:50S ribosomal protein L16 3-hydroxylase n=1 Tax=Marinobacterium mangrovicola TaxID=1476959 RepID=A0A4R1GLG2_9GAMM|nr:cupin domain-containing protein [Marinobacterium mangrovicola]TCK09397.1 50S ribosomal protein L16 3-hydroxylase [Marinobacterium mangrovicola]
MIDQYPLGELSAEQFLAEYWQKKPLLIRQAIADFVPPVSADELAGLACEEEVESRLVQFNAEQDSWSLEHGPFPEERFANLPESHWTLLVQAVDHWSPEAADLMQRFSFIPNWRVDDLMISYAADQGGVGPHYDNYDVFLLQAEGVRRWEIGAICDETSPRREDAPVMILPEWVAEETFDLQPGDMLYLPPQVAHNGYALGDGCMTYSIGFRAPAHNEILRSFSDFIGEQLGREIRYSDKDLALQANPGEITPAALDRVAETLHNYLQDREQLSRWFGEYMTDPKYPELKEEGETLSPAELAECLEEGYLLRRNEGARFAFVRNTDNSTSGRLFAEGNSYPVDGDTLALAEQLCGDQRSLALNADEITNTQSSLLCTLIQTGSLYLSEE